VIGNIAGVYLFFACNVLRTDEFPLALLSPGALVRLSNRQLFVVVAGTVAIVAGAIVPGWLERAADDSPGEKLTGSAALMTSALAGTSRLPQSPRVINATN
jgi:hypothetical protein